MGSKFWLAPGLVFALSRSPESRWHVDRFMRAVSEFFSLVFELRLRGAANLTEVYKVVFEVIRDTSVSPIVTGYRWMH